MRSSKAEQLFTCFDAEAVSRSKSRPSGQDCRRFLTNDWPRSALSAAVRSGSRTSAPRSGVFRAQIWSRLSQEESPNLSRAMPALRFSSHRNSKPRRQKSRDMHTATLRTGYSNRWRPKTIANADAFRPHCPLSARLFLHYRRRPKPLGRHRARARPPRAVLWLARIKGEASSSSYGRAAAVPVAA